MSPASRLYRLALRAYPADFRRETGDEVLGTIMDGDDAGEGRGVLTEAASLAYNGNKLRWADATGRSVAQTFRQGLAWGAVALISWQAGRALLGVVRPAVRGWGFAYPWAAEMALAAGWLTVLVLLLSGRRRWGLGVLSVVLAGYAANETVFALGYGGRFSWTFTLGFFVPVVAPLLCAFLTPRRKTQFPRAGVASLVVLGAVVPSQMVLVEGLPGYQGWIIEVALCLAVGIVVLVASLSDPRWAVAATLVVFKPLIAEFLPELSRSGDFSAYLGVLLLALFIPLSTLVLVFRARRRTVRR